MGPAMAFTPTTEWVAVAGQMCRRWEGKTPQGNTIHLYVAAVGMDTPAGCREVEALGFLPAAAEERDLGGQRTLVFLDDSGN